MLLQAATLNARMTLSDSLDRLEHYPDDSQVVVQWRLDDEDFWFHYTCQAIREAAAGMDQGQWPNITLEQALELDEFDSVEPYQLAETPAEALKTASGVLLDGSQIAGVLVPSGQATGTRSTVAAGPTATMEMGAAPDSGPRRFQAFPHTDAPAGVKSGETFEFQVGLGAERQSEASEAIEIEDVPDDEFDLLVQVIAPGFRAPAGTQRFLHVVRDELEANSVSFTLEAEDEPDQPLPRTIEVQFSYNGNVCGRAWREIMVLPARMSAGDAPQPATGSSPVATPGKQLPPDLTVSITEADDDGHFIWLFTSPHDVELHSDDQVASRLRNDNARSFAVKILKGIPGSDGTRLSGKKLLGTAREIADEMPVEFWDALDAVWRHCQSQGETPRLLFLSAEPYVPWELVSVESDYVDPELVDASLPLMLNAQARVGRWLPPRPRTPRGGDRPAQPPEVEVEVRRMAVVVGDYLAMSGIRPLPEAQTEGEALAERYNGIRLSATEAEILDLLDNKLQADGEQVDIELMHFACHGQADPNNPTHNGIILNEGVKLDPTSARGNMIGRQTRPFAFLNACEVGQAGETLGSYGGLAAAFLNEGFRGFVAPLWAVNDTIAHEISLEFYARALENGEPVAEVLRSLRGQYDPEADSPCATWLAYIYYGHPDLVLTRPTQEN